jgi:membrane protease YdiL (CAAX protease family)
LCRGNLAAPAQPIPFLGLRKPIPWTVFGPALLVVFGVALPLFLYFTVHPDFTAAGRILHFLPWILLIAALNAANEEFQFRSVLLAHLRNVVSPPEAVLLTAVLFGLGHYYGQPSGPIGVLMAGFAGWIWARSMIETRGFAWAFFIHMVQDIVIFSFLAVGAGM